MNGETHHHIVHTPPKWTIEPHGKGFALYSGRDKMRHGANLVYLTEPDANWEATKRLIESVPELLQACQDTITYLATHADDDSNALWGKVSAAYRKAKGIDD